MEIGEKLAAEIVVYSVKYSIRATLARYPGLTMWRVQQLRREANVCDQRRVQKTKAQRREIAEYAAEHTNQAAMLKYKVGGRMVQLCRKEFGLQPVRKKKQQEEKPAVDVSNAKLHSAISIGAMIGL